MPADKLPIGIQDFEKLITGNNIYVDKTEYLYNLITKGKAYFISRPRRFGKSVTVSTLEAIFTGKRELFKDLWLDNSDWDWQTYPIIRLDMSEINRGSRELLAEGLINRLKEIAASYKLSLTGISSADYLRSLIKQLGQIGKVVVLVDEYDKPIIDNLKKIDIAIEIREELKDFYTILKSQDANLNFVFLTGVTKFAKVSVFSGVNNLNDITMHNYYSAMIGYTEVELKKYFDHEVSELAKTQTISKTTCYKQLKNWYDGYCFSSAGEPMYNPFSVLSALDAKEFRAFWFATGTPTFLLDLIKHESFDLLDLENLHSRSADFESFEIQTIPLIPLLYQTGYFSVKAYDQQLKAYSLGYPNYEVSEAFTESLIKYFATEQATVSKYSLELAQNLLKKDWDTEQFISLMKKIMATMPYDLYIKEEKHYHSIFYLILKQAGLTIQAEYHTQLGRADLVLETKDKILIFELKYNQTAKAAMQQINDKQYYDMFLDRNLPIFLIAINFDGETRSIDDYLIQAVSRA